MGVPGLPKFHQAVPGASSVNRLTCWEAAMENSLNIRNVPTGHHNEPPEDVHRTGHSNKLLNRISASWRSGMNVMRVRFGRPTRTDNVIEQAESQRLIISVHLPKTAGTSFAAALDGHFRIRFLRDYSDFPIITPQPERNRAALQASLRNAESEFADVECIHGHFLPIKYLLLVHKREVKFVTWMRHPVDRVLSHFYHWKKSYSPRSAPLHRRVVEENWSVERFCLGPEVRNLYWQFLWGFPINYFDFIGITEFYEDDLAYFGQHYLGAYIKAKRLNVRKHRACQIDRSFRNEIEAFHDRDMELYRNALEKRLSRHGI